MFNCRRSLRQSRANFGGKKDRHNRLKELVLFFFLLSIVGRAGCECQEKNKREAEPSGMQEKKSKQSKNTQMNTEDKDPSQDVCLFKHKTHGTPHHNRL